MIPFWYKPDYQPNPATPVEFQLKPLDLRTAYETAATRYGNGMLAPDALLFIFSRNVLDWRGIDAPCTPDNRTAAMRTDDTVFGNSLGTWMVWAMDVGTHLTKQAMLTDEERKNS